METADDVVTKTKFAALCGVSRPCVSQWIRGKKIYGAALIGDGRDKRIRVDIARQQLKQTLDVSQRLGANGKLRFDDDPADVSVEDDIRRARLEQIQLANEQARALREIQAGRYTDTATVRREMGGVAARMLSVFEGSLGEFATAVAAKSNLPARDALHVLRTAFHVVRERAS